MTETKVPGIAAKRVVITDECRAIHGDGGAFNRAALQLLAEYSDVTARRKGEKGLNYHLVLTVEDTKPPAKRPTEVLPPARLSGKGACRDGTCPGVRLTPREEP